MKKNSGFTLAELMITIAVAAILVTVAIPSFREIIKNNQASTQANLLLTSLNLARSEAVKRGSTVSICSSTNQASCNGTTSWATGWIVFTDQDSDGTIDAGTDTILKVQESIKGSPTLTGPNNDLQYFSTGMASAAATFTLTMPDCTGNQVRTIELTATGRASVSTDSCP